MSVLVGHNGRVAFTKDGSDSNAQLSTSTVFRWRLQSQRDMVPVTPKNVSFHSYRPGHGVAIVDIEAYIDQDVPATGPGVFNSLTGSLTLFPDGSNAGSIIAFGNCWVESFEWQVGMDVPNIILARLRSTDTDPIYVWGA